MLPLPIRTCWQMVRAWLCPRGGLANGWLRVAAIVHLSCAAGGAIAAEPPLVDAVVSIGITVTDLDRSVGFYRDVLSFREVRRYEVAGEDYERLYGTFGLRLASAELALGGESIELMQVLAPAGRPIPAGSRSNDRWFQHIAIITRDMERAYAHLRAQRVAHASPGPQRLPDWNPNAGGIMAFYFRDPDGNHLEILQFPPDKGDRRWHAPGDALFLGIDHTAIVVADTAASTRFYQDLLGLQVAGTSENYGPEQERLNNVFGARLLITAFRAAAGPGVELLEYLAPADGRPMPQDTRVADLWHWQINMRSAEPEAVWRRSRHAATLISPQAVSFADQAAGFRTGIMMRDPDGHATLVQQR